ncbi:MULTISPECIES: formate dehydrogenase accessory sulfurtransferase FdhD [unclassified Sporosarcina]|uniref:formate dehydrogenase accessory sulfurtransferase FdhD n=1 Tax=unclassified Sporosarcina TaxID=2647733 RepID=UPI000C16EC2F|nr:MULTISPECIES: formate dehydrogenase accessory sulfurtransferase FdhD [unclassified Sporosarcina]PIC87714.1 formate dehydrogenase family accessory protein FdhD [Sporosarcina sp. P20a]PID00254.1 formate dehydrogenase family accessory protein FdhD [Sporosarcina sp. P29]PID06938.1 formate dehydrogenase family accessory protein FdhD [Sporosarcina sp. P30]PID10132.1 formate dehydrogenase family accessory protein FdhD [Sporosarcina sp. P31]PID13711.1 formate dehydrogenase family accessory protein 
MEQQQQRSIIRFQDGTVFEKEDSVAVEYAITIKLNNKEFATIVCTPEYIEDMTVGFLASEGIVPKWEQVKDIRLDLENGFIYVDTDKAYPFFEQLQNKRYITSCCGMSRQGFIFANDALTAKKMDSISVKLTPVQIFSLMNQMEDQAEMFRHTGGVHNAALCVPDQLLLSRMDIGRHNALDKIYGHCLKNDISVRDKIIVFSGRISSEILLKVAKIGCEIVLSKSAPTELALSLADDLGITTVGFIRGGSFNVYTHPERIVMDDNSLFPTTGKSNIDNLVN